MDDILDTRFEGTDVELKRNLVNVGDEIDLLKADRGLRRLRVGIGWDVAGFDTDSLDMDVSVFLLGKDDKTRMDEDFVFYNNAKDLNGAVAHTGDSRTGAGDGDDESIMIDMHNVSFDVHKLVFVVSIYRGDEKAQRMGQVQNAYVRLENADNGIEICRYELKDMEGQNETAAVLGQLNHEGTKWVFLPQAEFVEGGLAAVATRYGCTIIQS